MLDRANKLLTLFVEIDDLLLAYTRHISHLRLAGRQLPGPCCGLSPSEVATIIVFYQLSGYKNFQYYYQQLILGEFNHYFPKAPGYKHFLSLLPRCLPVLVLWMLSTCAQALKTGYYYIDSTKLPVCHINRQCQHQVFKEVAAKGKTTTGWFYGFKLHLVINHLGQIVNFAFTPGNVADNNHKLLRHLLGNLQGKCAADKGYYTQLFDAFLEQGLQLILKPKKNMKKQTPALPDDVLFSKSRAVVESVNDILKTVCNVEHTRHRKVDNALAHMVAALIAYQSLDKKPHVFIPNAKNYLEVMNSAA